MKNIVYFLAILSVVEMLPMEHQAEKFEDIVYPWIDHLISKLNAREFQSKVNVVTLMQFVKHHYDDLEDRLMFPRKKINLPVVVKDGCAVALMYNEALNKVGMVNKTLHTYVATKWNYKNFINNCVKEVISEDYIIDYGFMCAYLFQHTIAPDHKLLFTVGSDILAATLGRYDDCIIKGGNKKDDTFAHYSDYQDLHIFCELFGLIMTESNSSDDIISHFKLGFNRNTTCSLRMLRGAEHEQLFNTKLDCSGLRDYANTLYAKMMKKILFFKKTAEFTVYSDDIIIAPYDLGELEQQGIIAGPQEAISIASNMTRYQVTLTDVNKLCEQTFALVGKN